MPDKYESQHIRNLNSIERAVNKLYSDADFELSYFVQSTFAGSVDYTSSPLYKQKADELERRIHDGIVKLVGESAVKSDNLSSAKNKATIKTLTEKNKGLRASFSKEFGTSSGSAAKYFAKRKKEDFNISERVWNITATKKSEMADAVNAAIESGVSADKLASEIQKYLREPDKRFRRVRNANGKLVDSQARANYHPGQGVYKSSKANAFRLARTETNIAYRGADNERWQQENFVTGVDVRLSNSHGKECDICNYLAGRYPKDFIFRNWHPSCLCVATPVLVNAAQLNEMEDYELGLSNKQPSITYESEIPKRASDHIKEQAKRINGWKTTPLWVSDNPKYVSKLLKK